MQEVDIENSGQRSCLGVRQRADTKCDVTSAGQVRGDGAAAYRSGSELRDERTGDTHDFTAKDDIVHSEILLPEGAPVRLSDRSTLWNEVEQREARRDAQLAREVEFSLPRELTTAENIALARDFTSAFFVKRGMIADLNVHVGKGLDVEGNPVDKPHAHVMLTMRAVDKN